MSVKKMDEMQKMELRDYQDKTQELMQSIADSLKEINKNIKNLDNNIIHLLK